VDSIQTSWHSFSRSHDLKSKIEKDLLEFAYIDKNKKTIICGFGTEKFNEEAGASIESNNITLIEADKETLSKTLLDCFLTNKNCKKVEDHEGPVYIRKSDAEY